MSSWSFVDMNSLALEMPHSSVYWSNLYLNEQPSSVAESAWYSTSLSVEALELLRVPVSASRNKVSYRKSAGGYSDAGRLTTEGRL